MMEQKLIDIECFSVKDKVLQLLPKDPKLISATGIYKLYFSNDVKKRVYIGSAIQTNSGRYKKFRVGFYIRLYHHIMSLRAGTHHSPKLQNYVNKYGFENLVFEIVELCDKSVSRSREEFYIKQFNCVKLGFNCSHDGHTGGGIIPLETRRLITLPTCLSCLSLFLSIQLFLSDVNLDCIPTFQ